MILFLKTSKIKMFILLLFVFLCILLTVKSSEAAAQINYPARILLISSNTWQGSNTWNSWGVFNGSVTINGDIELNGNCVGSGCGSSSGRTVVDMKIIPGVLPSNVDTSTTIYANSMLVERDMYVNDILVSGSGGSGSGTSKTIFNLVATPNSLPENTRSSESIYVDKILVDRNIYVEDILQ